MPDKRKEQPGENADLTRGGGTSTDRGGRDSGTPGPVDGGSQKRDDAAKNEEPRSGTAPS